VVCYTNEHFYREYNFPPASYVDYLSLIGDKVDNIKGVKGIGPVSAKNLIQQFGSVKNIYQKISDLPENTKKLLVNQEKLIQRNKKIISLVSDLPLPNEQYQNCDFQ
jgi:DNA polymerase I